MCSAGGIARGVEVFGDRGLAIGHHPLAGVFPGVDENRGRPSQAIAEPSCGWPSRSMRPPSPTSRSSATVPASSTPARMRSSTCGGSAAPARCCRCRSDRAYATAATGGAAADDRHLRSQRRRHRLVKPDVALSKAQSRKKGKRFSAREGASGRAAATPARLPAARVEETLDLERR